MNFAKWTYRIAGLLGLLQIVPALFMEGRFERDFPPVLTHPIFYYGFIGVVVAWQVAFLLISTDPLRYRPLMWATFLEKFGYAIAVTALYVQHRVADVFLVSGVMDFGMGVAFVIAYFLTKGMNRI